MPDAAEGLGIEAAGCFRQGHPGAYCMRTARSASIV